MNPERSSPVSRRAKQLAEAMQRPLGFYTQSTWSRRRHEPGIADFVFGNPHEMPLRGLVDALREWSVPLNKDWFAYKASEPESRRVVADSLRRRMGMPFEPPDIALTTGSFAALAIALRAVGDPGDEVIINMPAWFFYEPLALGAGLTPVKVNTNRESFDLDLNAIAAAITPRTRAVILNSPNNPTGKIYPAATLKNLASLLGEASRRNHRPIYVLSDEPYSRIVFDSASVYSPAEAYPYTLIAYSYGKILLAPGQRIGYLAVPPTMPEAERAELRRAILTTQIASGWTFPNAVLQHALPDIDQLSIDIRHLQVKRDRMLAALRDIGYQVATPEGTFYLMPKSPLADDLAFAEMLAERDVLVLPGTVFEFPGYFRMSLTANDEMIERSLPGFAAAFDMAADFDCANCYDDAAG